MTMPVEIKKLPRDTYEARAATLLRMIGLAGFERKYPWQLSRVRRTHASHPRAFQCPARRSEATSDLILRRRKAPSRRTAARSDPASAASSKPATILRDARMSKSAVPISTTFTLSKSGKPDFGRLRAEIV
jgi:hypothetical protein